MKFAAKQPFQQHSRLSRWVGILLAAGWLTLAVNPCLDSAAPGLGGLSSVLQAAPVHGGMPMSTHSHPTRPPCGADSCLDGGVLAVGGEMLSPGIQRVVYIPLPAVQHPADSPSLGGVFADLPAVDFPQENPFALPHPTLMHHALLI
ncbi:MAG: hypothetical protein OEW12_02520 [Deltaproteobacteria bacterium]|nr:hypothetical protein [Deltaproteobacteria bacterium]